ncbi:MFS multidrug transporter-like protein [Ophiobolus disseminans]|uniref:MFS multidrug transporter-like protein n=1 Tax=Ophiobolus disseminans TaxID=1469910 RepID=A0A6A6ZZC7_9PLEO|nr:MFS multidrug transporter-like protein [Ophiobolus disseminans]
MTFKDRLLGRPSISEETPRESVVLPRFTFESDDRPLVSTERLFRQWQDEETQYDSGYQNRDPALRKEHDIIITWDGPNDPRNPLNWSQKRKWVVTILVSMFTFISPFSSTMVTPALPDIADDFDIPAGFMRQLVMTIFLLGYAQGPFVLAPLSEIFGRVTVLQYANLIYLLFNTMCGFAQTQNQMLAFRFLSGLGGAAPQALCNGVLADTWRKEERGKGQAIYGMLTWIAPCVAPICGAYISQSVSWRWIFFATSIFTVFVQVTAFFFLAETFAPAILAKKAKIVRKAMKGIRPDIVVRTEYETGDRFSKILRKRLILPFIMMFTHPATQAPSIYRAYLYGVMYLMLSTFPMVFEEVYDMSVGTASLNYLSLCLGFMIGLRLSHPLMDGLYARLKTYYNVEEGLPEFRVPPMLIAGILCPIGLFIYGWTAHYGAHWIAPNIGSVIIAIGLIIGFQCSQAYTTDAYEAKYAASAASVGAFTRTMMGFSFPLFAPRMYETMGLGWGNSLLAFLTLGLALVSPVLLWFYGPRLRAMSTRGLE